jgi:hypothetical protein
VTVRTSGRAGAGVGVSVIVTVRTVVGNAITKMNSDSG